MSMRLADEFLKCAGIGVGTFKCQNMKFLFYFECKWRPLKGFKRSLGAMVMSGVEQLQRRQDLKMQQRNIIPTVKHSFISSFMIIGFFSQIHFFSWKIKSMSSTLQNCDISSRYSSIIICLTDIMFLKCLYIVYYLE